MSRVNLNSPPGGILSAAATATDTVMQFPAGTYAAMNKPVQMWIGSVELVNVTAVTGTDPETWSVVRGVDQTAAVPHAAGTTVERTYPLSEVIYHPGGLSLTLGSTYTPDADIKYHFLLTGASNVTVNPPTKSGGAQIGDELRFIITQGNVARSVTFSTAAGGYNVNGFSVTGTKNTISSVSFAYNGTTWIRQQ